MVYSNPGLYFPAQQFRGADDWLKYSAKLTSAALKYKQMIDFDQIPKDRMGKALLDMAQYKKIFGTCRIPGHNMDQVEFNPGSRHIVVAYRNGVSTKRRNIFSTWILDQGNNIQNFSSIKFRCSVKIPTIF